MEEDKIYTEIEVYLFGKPESMIENGRISIDDLRKLGERLKDRMYRVANIIELLEKNGWERSDNVYYMLFLYKDTTKDKAVAELNDLKIDIKDVAVIEHPTDE